MPVIFLEKGKILHTKTAFYLFLFFIIFLPSHIFAKDMIADLLPPDEDYTVLFPRTITMKGFAYTNNCKISGPVELTMYNNPGTGQFEFTFTSPLSNAELVIDKYMNPVSSKTSFLKTNKELIKKAGHDSRIYSMEKKGKEPVNILLTHFQDDKVKKKRQFSYDRNTFPSDMVMLALQALLLKGVRKDFMLDIISLEDALKVRVSMTYYFTSSVLSFSENFPFPQGINEAVRPDEKYHVFKMKLQGLPGIFIRSSWFFVYEEVYPFGCIVYWGGDGKTAEVFYFLENRYIYDKK